MKFPKERLKLMAAHIAIDAIAEFAEKNELETTDVFEILSIAQAMDADILSRCMKPNGNASR